MAAQPWPKYLIQSLTSANQPQFTTNESVYYDPYTSSSTICSAWRVQTPRDARDVVSLFIVELNKHPVFFIAVKPPASFVLASKRKQADDQMRDRFRDLSHLLVILRLPAISAFGTHPVILNDVAPADRWSCDLLDADDIARVRQVAQDVRTTCQALAD
ncbi:hypothetical protein SERLA73DRAFT_190015 [Serpula lacrymans var. lacrymans S7.3]|uniref:Uncharacterized protein n=1 Tax=Serpula lacrymans var. lacrymans (strain S7.3) TaxID=936435 RepID=F8QEY0_SERL3|nr:hypothetical protein SERLA73DRAFT_190015 [Serpula lacrymans var. lacrymans S7.3]